MPMTPPAWYLPHSDTLFGNHPELAVHPQMNSRSEQRASYYVRASIAFHLSCVTIVCYACFVFIVSSPLSYCPVVPTTDVDAPLFDYFIDDRVPLPSSFQASRATSPLPHIAYLSIFICCTRHMLLLCYFSIQMHSLSLSPLIVPFLYPMQPIINIIYSSEPCALLVNRIR